MTLARIRPPVWFRGQTKSTWGLVPSLFREENMLQGSVPRSEVDMMRRFKQDATVLLDPRPTTPHEWLFVMRHNEVPTRLLDWTENPLVAAYFAVTKEGELAEDGDGAIWALLPIELNNKEGRQLGNYLPSFEEDQDNLNMFEPTLYNERENFGRINPIAFISPRTVARMQVQLSVFTIHHKQQIPIERVGNGRHVWRYIIPTTAKRRILDQLRLLGIDESRLFPELDKIGRKLGVTRD